jgi:peptidoglycan/LPS O-acetylase OafA/YrhL
MPIAFSLYLDLVRFGAAMLVFLAHISLFTKGTILWRLEPYGGIAVTIFFVLSGYVIAYVVATRENTAKQYFTNRIARLYSVVLIALLVTFVFDKIGMRLDLESYKIPLENAGYISESWQGYLSSLFFVNEFQVFGFNGIAPGSNAPFWSLSFEATYYLIAGLVLFSCNRIVGIIAALLILILAGKTIAILLPTWLLGYTIYHVQDRLRLPVMVGCFLFFFSGIAILSSPHFSDMYLPKENPFGIWFPYNWLAYNRHFLNDYNIAIIFAIHLISARSILPISLQIHIKIKTVIRWLGLLTFPLYCLHFPILCLFSVVSPWNNRSVENLMFVSLLTFLLVIMITPVCELLKRFFRKMSSNDNSCGYAN